MTIAPLPTAPVTTGSAAGSAHPGAQGGPAGADAFAALVGAVLEAGAVGPADEASQEPPSDDTSEAPDPAQDGTTPATVPVPVVVPPALVAALALGRAAAPGSGGPSTDCVALTVDPAPPTGVPAAGGEPSTGSTDPTVDLAPLPGTAPAPAAGGGSSTVSPPRTVEQAPPTAAPAPAATPGGGPSTDSTRQTVDPAPPTDQATSTSSSSSPSTATSAAPALVGTDQVSAPVADRPTTQVTRSAAAQVVPELTRLVQAGPGTHRMVLRLDPEHLGEVRITLTVHPGGVRVRMATGTEDARATLHEGLPALHRALEAAGRPAGDTHVTLLHQPAPGGQTGNQTGHQTGQPGQGTDPAPYDGAPGEQQHPADAQAASDHQTPDDRPRAGDGAAGRPAGTQVDTTARDGSQGAGTPRPADPLTSDAARRLDVSM